MKRTLAVVLLLAAIALLVGWRWFGDRANASTARNAATIDDAEEDARRSALLPMHDDVTNNAVLNLQDAIRRHGPDSRQARDRWILMDVVCGTMELNPHLRPAHPTPDRAWAWAKLDAECKRFRAQRWPDFPSLWKGKGHPGLIWVWMHENEDAATALAVEAFRNKDPDLLYDAGIWLLERGLFPHQADYGLEHEQLARAFDLARRLYECPAINGCGPASIQTAMLCSEIGCPPGVSYADAARRQLTPQEYAAAMHILEMLSRTTDGNGARTQVSPRHRTRSPPSTVRPR